MNLVQINENINRLLTNIWAVLAFFKEYLVDPANDVSMTFINADGTETTRVFPNLAKQAITGAEKVAKEWEVGDVGIVMGSDGLYYAPNRLGYPESNDPVLKVDNSDWYGGFALFIEALEEYKISPLREDIVVNVPSDFATINLAIEHLVNGYINGFTDSQTNIATINLESGFVMKEQVMIEGHDLGWITIIGDDPVTNIDTDFITTAVDYGYANPPAFYVSDGGLPIIGQLFQFIGTGEKIGITVFSSSKATILDGCGVKNAYIGCYIGRLSTALGVGSIFSDSIRFGIHVSDNSSGAFKSANFSGAGEVGAYANIASNLGVILADGTNCTVSGAWAENTSTIDAQQFDGTGAGEFGVKITNGSIVNALSLVGTMSETPNTLTSKGIIFKE